MPEQCSAFVVGGPEVTGSTPVEHPRLIAELVTKLLDSLPADVTSPRIRLSFSVPPLATFGWELDAKLLARLAALDATIEASVNDTALSAPWRATTASVRLQAHRDESNYTTHAEIASAPARDMSELVRELCNRVSVGDVRIQRDAGKRPLVLSSWNVDTLAGGFTLAPDALARLAALRAPWACTLTTASA